MTEITVDMVERRAYPRFRTKTTVQVRSNGKSKMCQCVNMSAVGVAVETGNFGLQKGTTVELNFAVKIETLVKVHRRVGVVSYVANGITGFSMTNPYKK